MNDINDINTTKEHSMKEITRISNQEIDCNFTDAIVIVKSNDDKYTRDEDGNWKLISRSVRFAFIGWHTAKNEFVNKSSGFDSLDECYERALAFAPSSCIFLLDNTSN
jgi:hypothetical protein